MNVFSNVGITELIIILLLALLVVGPERLPEIGRKVGKGLRDVRRAYENLTRDFGPELQSIQKATLELRESVESVRTIPQDAVKKVVRAAELEDTLEELKGVAETAGEARQILAKTARAVQSPVSTAVSAAKGTLRGQLTAPPGAKGGSEPAPQGEGQRPAETEVPAEVPAPPPAQSSSEDVTQDDGSEAPEDQVGI